jgi:hypothetical protein
MKKSCRILMKIALGLFGLFAGTVAIWWFNLDNKLIYNFVYPLLQKHYNEQERDRRF